MPDITVQGNSTTPPRQYGGAQLRVLDLISRFAPREWKESHGSARGRWSMACPLPDDNDRQHGDGSGSFSLDASGQLWKCFGCGAGGNAFQLQAILGGGADVGLRAQSPPRWKQPQKTRPDAAERPTFQGVTIEQLAEAKGLSVNHLRGMGWRDTIWSDGTHVVEIPYLDEYGGDPQIRYRVGLDQGPFSGGRGTPNRGPWCSHGSPTWKRLVT